MPPPPNHDLPGQDEPGPRLRHAAPGRVDFDIIADENHATILPSCFAVFVDQLLAAAQAARTARFLAR